MRKVKTLLMTLTALLFCGGAFADGVVTLTPASLTCSFSDALGVYVDVNASWTATPGAKTLQYVLKEGDVPQDPVSITITDGAVTTTGFTIAGLKANTAYKVSVSVFVTGAEDAFAISEETDIAAFNVEAKKPVVSWDLTANGLAWSVSDYQMDAKYGLGDATLAVSVYAGEEEEASLSSTDANGVFKTFKSGVKTYTVKAVSTWNDENKTENAAFTIEPAAKTALTLSGVKLTNKVTDLAYALDSKGNKINLKNVGGAPTIKSVKFFEKDGTEAVSESTAATATYEGERGKTYFAKAVVTWNGTDIELTSNEVSIPYAKEFVYNDFSFEKDEENGTTTITVNMPKYFASPTLATLTIKEGDVKASNDKATVSVQPVEGEAGYTAVFMVKTATKDFAFTVTAQGLNSDDSVESFTSKVQYVRFGNPISLNTEYVTLHRLADEGTTNYYAWFAIDKAVNKNNDKLTGNYELTYSLDGEKNTKLDGTGTPSAVAFGEAIIGDKVQFKSTAKNPTISHFYGGTVSVSSSEYLAAAKTAFVHLPDVADEVLATAEIALMPFFEYAIQPAAITLNSINPVWGEGNSTIALTLPTKTATGAVLDNTGLKVYAKIAPVNVSNGNAGTYGDFIELAKEGEVYTGSLNLAYEAAARTLATDGTLTADDRKSSGVWAIQLFAENTAEEEGVEYTVKSAASTVRYFSTFNNDGKIDRRAPVYTAINEEYYTLTPRFAISGFTGDYTIDVFTGDSEEPTSTITATKASADEEIVNLPAISGLKTGEVLAYKAELSYEAGRFVYGLVNSGKYNNQAEEAGDSYEGTVTFNGALDVADVLANNGEASIAIGEGEGNVIVTVSGIEYTADDAYYLLIKDEESNVYGKVEENAATLNYAGQISAAESTHTYKIFAVPTETAVGSLDGAEYLAQVGFTIPQTVLSFSKHVSEGVSEDASVTVWELKEYAGELHNIFAFTDDEAPAFANAEEYLQLPNLVYNGNAYKVVLSDEANMDKTFDIYSTDESYEAKTPKAGSVYDYFNDVEFTADTAIYVTAEAKERYVVVPFNAELPEDATIWYISSIIEENGNPYVKYTEKTSALTANMPYFITDAKSQVVFSGKKGVTLKKSSEVGSVKVYVARNEMKVFEATIAGNYTARNNNSFTITDGKFDYSTTDSDDNGTYVQKYYRYKSSHSLFGTTTVVNPFDITLALKSYEANGGEYTIGMRFGDDDATLIEDIAVEVENDAIFDLMGRKVSEPVKGQIYIQNGKKFMVK